MAIGERDEEGEDSSLDQSKRKNAPSPWHKLVTEKPDRVIELIFAASVVIFAFLGWRNAQSTTDQTNQLIAAAKFNAYAADQNASASRSFAGSARGINQGVNDAVGRLQDQAKVTELARESAEFNAQRALQTTLDQFHADQRAWLGFQQISVTASGSKNLTSKTTDGTQLGTAYTRIYDLIVSGVDFKLANTGRTPAKIVAYRQRVDAKDFWPITSSFPWPHPDQVLNRPRLSDEGFGDEGLGDEGFGEVIPPGQERPHGLSDNNMLSYLIRPGTFNAPAYFLFVASVSYEDVWGKVHTSKMCIYTMGRWDGAYRFCPVKNSNTED